MSRPLPFASAVVAVGLLLGLSVACGGSDDDESVLVVQMADGGSLTADGNGTYSLVLEEIGGIVWFAERPERTAGRWTPEEFMSAWATSGAADDPPNAVIEVAGADSFAIELLDAQLDGGSGSFLYTVRLLDEPDVLGQSEQPPTWASRFSGASLFIDAFPTAVNSQVTD